MERGLDMIESLRGRAPDPDLRTSFLASVQDYYGGYVDLLMQMNERQPSAHFASSGVMTPGQFGPISRVFRPRM